MTNLYVRNLNYQTTSEDLHELFSKYGELKSTNVICDRETGQSKGFGFVDFFESSDAETALKMTDGTFVQGRKIRVEAARERESHPTCAHGEE